MSEPGFYCHPAHELVNDVQISDICVESSPFAPSDWLSKFPHPDLCCRRLTCMNYLKYSLPLACLGSASGDTERKMGRCRQKGQNSNSSSSLLLGHFVKDCSPLSKVPEFVRHPLLQLQVSLVLVTKSSGPFSPCCPVAKPGCASSSIFGWGNLTLPVSLDSFLPAWPNNNWERYD